jgi:cytochrome c-type biogenesis protein CcmH/NrfG
MADEAAQLAQRFPSDASAWVYLARAEAGLNNGERAREAYRRVLQIVPGHAEAANYLKTKK